MKDTAFLQATFNGTNREYSYPNKEYIDLIFVSLIVFLIDKYHKTISPESEVYNTGMRMHIWHYYMLITFLVILDKVCGEERMTNDDNLEF